MRDFFKNNAWVLMVLFFIAMIAVMYRIVDRPDWIGAETNMYDVPEEIADAAERWGAEYNVAPELIEAMCWYESNYDKNCVSSAGCLGVMQVGPQWHGERMKRCGVSDLFDVDGCIHVGVDYLVEILENDTEELAAALAIYNGQPKSKIDAAIYDGYMSTYAESILDLAYELETLHGKHSRARFTPGIDGRNAVG